MKQTMTKEFFGKEADFFLQDLLPKITFIRELNRERSAVKITFEVEN